MREVGGSALVILGLFLSGCTSPSGPEDFGVRFEATLGRFEIVTVVDAVSVQSSWVLRNDGDAPIHYRGCPGSMQRLVEDQWVEIGDYSGSFGRFFRICGFGSNTFRELPPGGVLSDSVSIFEQFGPFSPNSERPEFQPPFDGQYRTVIVVRLANGRTEILSSEIHEVVLDP